MSEPGDVVLGMWAFAIGQIRIKGVPRGVLGMDGGGELVWVNNSTLI